jgi:hypothetical protein
MDEDQPVKRGSDWPGPRGSSGGRFVKRGRAAKKSAARKSKSSKVRRKKK